MDRDASRNLDSVFEVGTVVGGRYEIQEMLGIGGMGAVYKAHDRELDRTIALKVIRRDLARNPQVLQRFKQELLTARQLTHRNVIRIFDLDEANGVNSSPWNTWWPRPKRILADRSKLTPEEAVNIMQQVCAGVAAAHAEGVIHCNRHFQCNKKGQPFGWPEEPNPVLSRARKLRNQTAAQAAVRAV